MLDQVVDDTTYCDQPRAGIGPTILPSNTVDYTQDMNGDVCYSILDQSTTFIDQRYS